ncbi:unnamed protein product [Sphagnum troendelagicum]
MAELKVVLTMALVQLLYSVYNLLVRASLVTGINPVVFAVYRDLLALLMLWPLAFFLERWLRSSPSPSFFMPEACWNFEEIYAFQVLALVGLAYTSAPLIAGIQNMTPVFTFIIGVVFRIETIRYSRPSGQAQILGFLACVGGAVTMSLYKGPVIFPNLLTSSRVSGSTNFQDQELDIVISEGLKKFIVEWKIDSWKFGSFCGIASSFLISIYINLQRPILDRYPAPVSVTALEYLVGAVLLALTSITWVKNPSSWAVSQRANLIAIAYAGVINSALNFSLQTWCLGRSGPIFVSIFAPVQTILTTILSLIFLGDPYHWGSLLGSILVVAGLYLVIWGQNEDCRSVLRSRGLRLVPDGQPGVKTPPSLEESLLHCGLTDAALVGWVMFAAPGQDILKGFNPVVVQKHHSGGPALITVVPR